ncbi:MAG: transcription-repair coupling factor [Candidatus Omnitrophica bacterium]|nr:transcription-repair coupling factor [Candidatus Omnitrophota bacterium]
MKKSQYLSYLEKSQSFQALKEITPKPGPKWCLGTSLSSLAFILSGLFKESQSSVMVILPDERIAEQFYYDTGAFLPEAERQFFPPLEPIPEENTFSAEAGERMKLLTTWASQPTKHLVVTCTAALIPLVPAPEKIKQTTFSLLVGEPVSRQVLVEQLFRYGYEEKDLVQFPGEFARRGGIIDLFPLDSPFPIRLEIFADRLQSIRRFQPATQISFERIDQVTLYPLEERLVPKSPLGLVTDFLQPVLIFLVEPEPRKKQAFFPGEKGKSLAEEKWSWLRNQAIICQRSFSGEIRGQYVQFVTVPTRERFRLTEPILWNRYSEEKLVIFSSNPSQELRLKEILAAKNISLKDTEFLQGTLSAGFSFPEIGLTFLSNDELFSRYQTRHLRPPRPEEVPLSSWDELKVGDYVVHYNEGIGRFLGLEKLTTGEKTEEFIVIQYADGDKLFVPLSQIDFVHRYIGAKEPSLSKLGSRLWLSTREKVKAAIRDMAGELYSLYLERRQKPGITFAPDDEWQREFEDSFPFEETPDQQQAIEQVKKDMMSPRIMDRLLCGDSGYGKTEVAMRAAFKAVTSGYQVAVLVPTTVLALQHYLTFKERLADFPVQLAMLSRLVPPAEQKQVIEKLSAGGIDIVIGTHRLLSQDIKFFRLGLLIIDEEQRFGVLHKERIKSIARRVDVLTLSATPIPRTLYLSLSGVRDISLIETPPAGRFSVTTYVGRTNPNLIREAIRHELDRGGQVFYLHNFVFDIDKVADSLRRLVPEARVGVAHGQMPAKTLEEVMEHFSTGEIDVLVATTIVENGVDIPRANTLIVDQSHRFGLADLYQLRGRVGRGKWRAYAYFFYPENIPLTEQSRERLKTIQELNRPGSGFQVALRDLEIRGAGNILGYQQHGFIEQIGFHLYCQFWRNISGELQGQPPAEPKQVVFPGILPPDYISSPRLRFWAYRRLASLKPQEIPSFLQEIEDRFGPVPEELKKLTKKVSENSP